MTAATIADAKSRIVPLLKTLQVHESVIILAEKAQPIKTAGYSIDGATFVQKKCVVVTETPAQCRSAFCVTRTE